MSGKPVGAMALGGLGGFNAHDAGVLAAAHECGLVPDIITCTSGAIAWTHLFLTNPGGIRDEVVAEADAVSGANALEVAVLGDPGIFQPAYASYWKRWFTPPSGAPVRNLLDRLFPAQLYESTRPQEYFAQIATDFRDARTPVMFNAYALDSGRELVFCNGPLRRTAGGNRSGSSRSPCTGRSATRMSASAPAFRPVVKADGPELGSGGPVLLFDVLVQEADRWAAGGPGEVGPRTIAGSPASNAGPVPGNSCRIRRDDTPVAC